MIRILWLGLVLLAGAACQSTRVPEVAADTPPDAGSRVAQLQPPFQLGADFPTGAVRTAQPATALREGEAVPDFTLAFPDGTTTALSALQGRAVMLNFWATWCGPCRHEIPLLLAQQEAHPDDWLVLAVNVKEPHAKVQAFAEEFAMQIPIVLDAEGEVVDLFQVRGFPTSVFIDREGRLVATWTGVLDAAKLTQLVEASLS